jgi:two-component system cell cycle sensor histidine kinase/response regulator CckA
VSAVRVLVVDDQPVVRAGFAAIIDAEPDLTVVAEAGDGAEAVRLARDHDGPIDLLVSDIVMPGAGGRVVAEQVSGIRQGVRVLFVSGYAADAILRHGIQQSEVAFLGKPFLPHQLAEKVRQVLDGREGQTGARLDARD